MSKTDTEAKDEGISERAAPVAPAESGEKQPVDVEIQEEAAKERTEGGYT